MKTKTTTRGQLNWKETLTKKQKITKTRHTFCRKSKAGAPGASLFAGRSPITRANLRKKKWLRSDQDKANTKEGPVHGSAE